MIAGLDSASMPSATQARAAVAGGIALWSGYLATKPRVGLYSPWSQAGFENARLCGSTPIAFCSGWDSPGALKALAAAWNVRLCLDVENGIRGEGPWVQGWLNVSGAGLYGNAPIHTGRSAPFHILAAYPGSGDVRATWWSSSLRPAGPCGWQWAGTHTEFGIGVDRGDYDDWFGGLHGGGSGQLLGEDMTTDQDALLTRIDAVLEAIFKGTGTSALPVIASQLTAIQAAVKAEPAGGATLDLSALNSKVDALTLSVGRIETALKGA